MALVLKIKSKNGQHVVKDLNTNSTLKNLKDIIRDLTQIPENLLNLKIGFPPKLLEISDDNSTLDSSGIKNGDIVIAEEKQMSQEEKEAIARSKLLEEDAKLAQQLSGNVNDPSQLKGVLLKRVVPADNSCLFTSIGFLLTGKVEPECASYMRQIIASQVNGDKHLYNEGFLARPNDEYCAWILKEDSWGGAIEVSILSQFYGIEFDVVDIQNAIINRFGEDKRYGTRGFLLFDGIHYDPLYLESFTGEPDRTVFSTEDEEFVFELAEQLARECKDTRQFTDVNKFTLKCLQCDVMLKGQVEAQNHAKKTGHANFGEV